MFSKFKTGISSCQNKRQFYRECAAAALGIADGNCAAVAMADFFCDGQTQAEMVFAAAGRAGLVEFIKNPLLLLVWDSHPGIHYLNAAFVSLLV